MANPGPDKKARLVPLRARCAARVRREQILRASGTCWTVTCALEGGERGGLEQEEGQGLSRLSVAQ